MQQADDDRLNGVGEGEEAGAEENIPVQRVKPSDVEFEEEESRSGFQTGGWKQLAMVGGIALLISFAVYWFVAKPNFDKFAIDITNVVTDMGKINAALETKADSSQVVELTSVIRDVQQTQQAMNTALNQKADTSQVTALSNKIDSVQSQLSAMPTKSDLVKIDNLVNDVGTLKTQFDTLNTSLVDINTSIDTMNTQITELQEGQGSDGTPSGTDDIKEENDVYLELQAYDTSISDNTSTDNSITARLFCENYSDKDIVVNSITMLVYSRFGSTVNAELAGFTTTIPLQFTFSKIANGLWYVTASPYYPIEGWKVKENDDRDGFLTIMLDNSQLTSGLSFNIELEDFDYNIDE